MKMKKTQSLKLILVGLLCSMGMSAWAANGDIFTDKKLVLQEVNGKAQVIAVASHNGTIVIPDEVQNSFDNDKTLKVSRIQQGWWQGGTLVLKRDGGQEIAGSTAAVNLLNGGGFILKIEATQLYDITMQEIVPVNSKITQFIVDAAAGLNMLPEHAFQKNKTIVDEAATAANQAAHDVAVAKAEAALNGGDEEVCYIKEGKFDGKQVYLVDGKHYILGAKQAEKILGNAVYAVLEINEEGEAVETNITNARISSGGNMGFYNEESNKFVYTGTPMTEDVCATVHTNSKAEDVADAEAAKELADQKVTEAHQATVDAEYAAAHPNTQVTQEQLDKKAAAERLEAAILAFPAMGEKPWTSMQKKVANHTGTNVNAVDAWYVAFILANDPEFLATCQTKWNPLVEEFIEAYEEFYGKEPRIVSEMQVQSYTFNSFGATGDIFHAGTATVDPGATQITFTPWANGLVEDRTPYDNYDVTAQAQGYYQIKVLENSVEDFVNNYYYVKVAPEDIDEANTYYVLYQKNEQGEIVPVGTLGESNVGDPLDVSGAYNVYSGNAPEGPTKTTGILTASYTGEGEVVSIPVNGYYDEEFDYNSTNDLYFVIGRYNDGSDILNYFKEDEFVASSAMDQTYYEQLPTEFGEYVVDDGSGNYYVVPVKTDGNIYGANLDGNYYIVEPFLAKRLRAISLTEDENIILADDTNVQADVLTTSEGTFAIKGDNLYKLNTGGKFEPVTVTVSGSSTTEEYWTKNVKKSDFTSPHYVYLDGAADATLIESAYYSYGDEAEETISGRYVIVEGKLYEMAEAFEKVSEGNQTKYYANATLVKYQETETLDTYTEVAVVKIKKDQLMTVARILPVPTEIDAANPSNDIRAAIAAGTADQDALDEAAEAAREAEAEAIAAAEEAAQALADAEQALADAEAALEAAENAPVVTVYKFEFGGDNDWLTNVQWDNDGIANFGAYCFKDCVKAKFSNNGEAGLFPSNTANIGEEAFLNCKQLDADLKNTNATIANIGNAAFMNTKTTTVALENATKLGDSNIGVNVWDNTPMVTINLLNTNLTQMPEGLAEDILRGADAKDCNNKPVTYTYEIKEGETATKTAKINSTLTTVVMPKNSNKVRDINFWFCEKLNSITIPAGVASIGEYALAGTALTGLDLTTLTKLTYVGDGAFAFNPELTSVKFAEEAPFESLEGDVFACDYSLEEIELNDSVKCLAAGLFADTQIKKLDLSTKQIEILPDLFEGSFEKVNDENSVCNSLEEILLPETVMNATNDEVVIPGLKVIGNHAFAYLQKIKTMTIPSSVWAMGTEAFAYCTGLEEVTAMDSRLTNLGTKTFRNCTSLKKFTFVTLSVIDPAFKPIVSESGYAQFDEACDAIEIGGMFDFDDTQFFGCKNPEVIVTMESMQVLAGQAIKEYAREYSTLVAFEPTIELTKGGETYSTTYYNTNYGTWIPADEADVYTAYQNVNEIIIYKAKKHNNYYKIPALNTDDYVGTSMYWFSRGWDQENVFFYGDEDGNIIDGPLTPAQGSPAVIIIAKKEKINVERHSRPGEKYQSTLDRDNELLIAGQTLYPNVTANICVWATDGSSQHTMYALTKPTQVIANGKVVFPLSAWQGTANGRLNVTFVDGEVTGIMSAKDYMKSLNDSEAIYSLQGVRVSTPVKGQLYIKGGKKFIQK